MNGASSNRLHAEQFRVLIPAPFHGRSKLRREKVEAVASVKRAALLWRGDGGSASFPGTRHQRH